MSRSLGSELTDDLFARLSGESLDRYAENVILISTVDENGFPHQAMLSYFEVIAKDRGNIRIATYADSTTTANMRRNGKATISVIDERLACYIKGSVEELSREMRSAQFNSKLNVRIEQILADEVNEEYEPGAYIASGVSYRNPNRAEQLERAKAILAELME